MNKKTIGLFFCCMSTFLVNMDNTIINIALPSIQSGLDITSISGLQWIVDSYLIVITSFLILGGSLGDKFGRKLIYQIGLILFGVSSFLIVFSQNLYTMIPLRVIQAIGGAMLNPNAMALINTMFLDKKSKSKAFAIWGSVVGIGMASGPLIGGPLVDLLGWKSIFYINLPLGLFVIIGTQLFVPESSSSDFRKFDFFGQLFLLISLFSITFFIIEAPQQFNQNNNILIASLTIFFLALVLLLLVERRVMHPVLDLSLFKNYSFNIGLLISIINYLILGGILFITVIHLQNYLHFSAIKTGLYTSIIAIMTAISAQLSGVILRKYGYSIPILLSGIFLIISSIVYVIMIDFKLSPLLLLLVFFFFGLCFGGINTPVNTIVMSSAPPNKSAVAGAITSSSRQFGQSIGVAIFGAIIALFNSDSINNFFLALKAINYLILILGIMIVIIGLFSKKLL